MNVKTILVPVDFSDVTDRVVQAAKVMAVAFQARLILLHVEEPEPDFVGFEAGPQPVRVTIAHEMRSFHQQLDRLKAEVAQSGAQEVLALHVQGPSIEKIVQESATHGADLIVIGSHGHGAFYHLLVGSVTTGVLKGAACPVLVVPSRAAEAASA